MRILISNDDGIYSPGIAALAEVACEFGSVRVVAPDMERSSSSHSVTHSRPLSVRQTTLGQLSAYRVDGTPADCVAVGAHLWEKVDLVLSGLNIGFNLGHSIWHSGTLAAAKQAVLLGMRGVAISAPATGDADFAAYKPWVRRVLELMLSEPTVQLINVNVPREPRGLLWTRVSVRHYDGRIVPTQDPLGRVLYWFTVIPQEEAEPGTDRWALERDYVSLTPLKLDLTDPDCLSALRQRQPLDEPRVHPAMPPARPSHEVREQEAAPALETPARG
jgi:5'-nucleotidase